MKKNESVPVCSLVDSQSFESHLEECSDNVPVICLWLEVVNMLYGQSLYLV